MAQTLDDFHDPDDWCQFCGAELPQDEFWGRRRYCSKACRVANASRRGKDERLEEKSGRECAVCHGEISPYKPRNARYCSQACRHIAEMKRHRLTCTRCGSTYEANRPDRRYCSQECAQNAYKPRQPCEVCGKPVKDRKKTRRFCSSVCHGAWMKGRPIAEWSKR